MTSEKRWRWARVFSGAKHQGLGGLKRILFFIACAKQLGSRKPVLVALRGVPRVSPRRERGERATWHPPPTWAPRFVGVLAVGIAFWVVFTRHSDRGPVTHSFEVIPYEDTPDDWLMRDAGTHVRLLVPLKRMRRQQAPPCAPPSSGEVEINEACWVGLNKRLPCGQFYEYDGKCYVPVRERPKRPTPVEP